MVSIHINYKRCVSDLCLIGAKYDTDKSSQRRDVSDSRHCHPYTMFYHSLFKSRRNDPLVIGEFGIAHGASLLMWEEYFPNATVHGFEKWDRFMLPFREKYSSHERIKTFYTCVRDEARINKTFEESGAKYDIIIDDSSHQFPDQARIILHAHKALKPGGVLIIEDVLPAHTEEMFMSVLQHVICEYQQYFFVKLDHVNRYSHPNDNDKLMVLVKAGGPPIFNNFIM
jgi:hypothetical protein